MRFHCWLFWFLLFFPLHPFWQNIVRFPFKYMYIHLVCARCFFRFSLLIFIDVWARNSTHSIHLAQSETLCSVFMIDIQKRLDTNINQQSKPNNQMILINWDRRIILVGRRLKEKCLLCLIRVGGGEKPQISKIIWCSLHRAGSFSAEKLSPK